MATTDLSLDQLENTISNNDIVMIDFWAQWCGPCKMFGPVFEQASEKYPDIAFTKVNTEEDPDMAAHFGVRSIPTLAIFRDKILLYKQAGALPEAALEEVITKVRELDMEEIRAQIAKEEPQED